MALRETGRFALSLLLSAALGLNAVPVRAGNDVPVGDLGNGGALLPNGQVVTPTAAANSTYTRLETGLRTDGTGDGAEAAATALSPDGKTLLG